MPSSNVSGRVMSDQTETFTSDYRGLRPVWSLFRPVTISPQALKFDAAQSLRARAAESHISRKTSEMWGTQAPLPVEISQ
jgi:hypothetical protein